MTNPIFGRRITDEFLNEIKRAKQEDNSWWQKILDHDELFVGVREDYLNVYNHGNSLIKLRYAPHSSPLKLTGETHKKYLGVEEGGNYVRSKSGLFDQTRKPIIRSLNELDALIDRAKRYHNILDHKSGGSTSENAKALVREKSGIQKFLQSNNDVIDLEVGISLERNPGVKKAISWKEGDRKIPRVDIVQLREGEDGEIALTFIEAKKFTNSELAADERPMVLGQLKQYKRLLQNDVVQDAVLGAYKNVCTYLSEIGLASPPKNPLVRKVYEGKPLIIDTEPVLLILKGADETRANWQKHEEKLRQESVKIEYLNI